MLINNKKIRETWMNLVNSKEDVINKLQSLKGKTKLKFYKNICNYYIEMKNRNFQSQKVYPEVLLLMKFLQTKSQIKKMNINYHDLYYTVIKVRDENEDIYI